MIPLFFEKSYSTATEAPPRRPPRTLRVLTVNCCLLLPGMTNATLGLEMAIAQIAGVAFFAAAIWALRGMLAQWAAQLHWSAWLFLPAALPLALWLPLAVGSHAWLMLVCPLKHTIFRCGHNPALSSWCAQYFRVNDYKSERVQQLAERFPEYDVVCCQEVFTSWWSARYREEVVQAAAEAGLVYSAHSPRRGPRLPQLLCCSGLLILSRWPIEGAAEETWAKPKHVPVFDWLHTTRGALYARVRVGGAAVHVFNTHFSPSEREVRDRVPLLKCLPNSSCWQKSDPQGEQARMLTRFVERCVRRSPAGCSNVRVRPASVPHPPPVMVLGFGAGAALPRGPPRPTPAAFDAECPLRPGDGDVADLSEAQPLQGATVVVCGDFNFALPSVCQNAPPPGDLPTEGYERLANAFWLLRIDDVCRIKGRGWLPSFGHIREGGVQQERLLTHPHLWGRHVTEDLIFVSRGAARGLAAIEPLEILDDELTRLGITHVSDHFGIVAEVGL
eukprot:TRINITY_DN25139_c0_g1_i1.p1 TRINITY_DN25139_c0_g1~~TRINITY_DN25139_c0_g1_i1.p1  ORF type:complete len:529 (+),score=141.08 TRINITY_DN25139_c0_g1_i1:82-1587(+)